MVTWPENDHNRKGGGEEGGIESLRKLTAGTKKWSDYNIHSIFSLVDMVVLES